MNSAAGASARALPPEAREGSLLSERYRIGRTLGAGGMGVVVAAEHVALGEPLAIKFLLPDPHSGASSELLSRFVREAWATSKIKSEYVVRVNDVGQLASGTPFIVMEYLDGVDLARLLQDGPFEVEQAVEFVLQACEALAEAHALGIFHRDLKPSNLFRVRRSDGLLAVKLLDFGISRVADPVSPRLTGSSATLGTPLYMSPEQMRSGRAADARSDVWALGVIAYELLSGQVPFNAENLPDLAVKIATEKPTPLRDLRRTIPAQLERVIARCLEKDSGARYESVAELALALVPFGPPRAQAHAERAQRILQESTQRGGPKVTRPFMMGTRGSHARLRVAETPQPEPRSRTRRIALGIALFAVVGSVLWLVSRALVPQPTAASVTPQPSAAVSPPALDPAPVAQPVPAEAPQELATPQQAVVEATPPPPAAVPVEPPKARRETRAAKATARPAPSAPAKDSELESLGGRL